MKLSEYIAYALIKDDGANNETIIVIDGDVKYKTIIKNGDYDYSDFMPVEVLSCDICTPIVSKYRTTITTKHHD